VPPSDQLSLELPDLAAPPPMVLETLNGEERAAVLDALARLMVKTVAPRLVPVEGAGDE
jgi:hypothetical protein